MQRDPRAFLWDVRESAIAIQSFVAGMDASAYAANEMAQAAVERKFEIIGEALNQLAKLDPVLASGQRGQRGRYPLFVGTPPDLGRVRINELVGV